MICHCYIFTISYLCLKMNISRQKCKKILSSYFSRKRFLGQNCADFELFTLKKRYVRKTGKENNLLYYYYHYNYSFKYQIKWSIIHNIDMLYNHDNLFITNLWFDEPGFGKWGKRSNLKKKALDLPLIVWQICQVASLVWERRHKKRRAAFWVLALTI